MSRDHITVMTRKGQITVPLEIRRALGLKEGDRVAVSLGPEEAGEARLRPAESVARRTAGSVKPGRALQGPLDLKEARRMYMEERAADILRKMSRD